MQTTFTIGDLAREFGVTLRTLRFYEDKDLIRPRRQGLNRLYGRRDRARLKLILLGKKVGFSLAEIKEMLELYDLRDGQTHRSCRLALAPLRRAGRGAEAAEARHRAGDRRADAHDGDRLRHAARREATTPAVAKRVLQAAE